MPEEVDVVIRGIRAHLSPEQMQVMELIACGYSYQQVGMELGLSKDGVRKRVSSVCDAIGAMNRVEALVLLLREGVIR